MNKYLHLGTLIAALTSGCVFIPTTIKPPTPESPAFCGKIDLKDGSYLAGPVALMLARYFVDKDATVCGYEFQIDSPTKVEYIDLNCDNSLDFVNVEDGENLDRETLAGRIDINIFDRWLRELQGYVCKENRIR